MNKKNSKANSSAKNKSSSRKLIIFLSLAIIVYFSFSYLWSKAAKVGSPNEISTFLDDDFEVADEVNNQVVPEISEEEISEMQEKSTEFIYQMLLKNQIQIQALKSDVKELNNQLSKYRNNHKIGKIILSYVKLREKFLADEFYGREFRSFRILSSDDRDLRKLAVRLGWQLSKFAPNNRLETQFSELVPELIAVKYYGDGDDLLNKIRRNISKIITVRRTDKIADGDIDAVISKVKILLKSEKYEESLIAVNSLEDKYGKLLKNFITNLQNRIEVEKTDQEILKYLNNIS